MTHPAGLPESRDALPRDPAGLPLIDHRFDLVAIYRTIMTEAAALLGDGIARARPADGYVSWDSLSDATAAANVIHLLTSALPIMNHLEAEGEDLDALAEILTAIINCRPLGDEFDCIHEVTDDAYPDAVHHLCIDLANCPNVGWDRT